MFFNDARELSTEFQEAHRQRFSLPVSEGSRYTWYATLANLLADRLRLAQAASDTHHFEHKQVYYFSMEFLIGNLLRNYLSFMQVEDDVATAFQELGIDMEEVLSVEQDAALGNGGLGRLAACFMDSMAALGIAGHGMSIRYRYGLFAQDIADCRQIEVPEKWLTEEYPWETRRSDEAVLVRFGGSVRLDTSRGRMDFIHEGYEQVRAVPYDVPVMALGNEGTVNTLRLWNAEALDEFDLDAFNRGDFLQALKPQSQFNAISYVLYPNDNNAEGRKLRLMQEYFFVCAGLHSIVSTYKKVHGSIQDIQEHVAIHINDTHPALCVPEMMRILLDEEGLGWDEAWDITVGLMSYTNHTVLPEALETWPLPLMRELLPRVCMIIEEINRRFMESLFARNDLTGTNAVNIAIIRNDTVHMAALAVVGSHSINGVAALHTQILKDSVMQPYFFLYPERFNNKTNGISHRTFLCKANRPLAALITDGIGDAWVRRPEELEKLTRFEEDASFLERLGEVKRLNRVRLSSYILQSEGILVDPDAIFDVQVKRLHAYKRQLLNVMHILYLYNRIKEGQHIHPRVFIFAGKAAPGYTFAKSVIHLINRLSQRIQNDPMVREQLQVVFMHNLNVSSGEMIYPAADISQQISTAGKEASGTGNMKFMMNGAVTLGTLDGANVEIHDLVGSDNIVTFGYTVEDIERMRREHSYNPWSFYREDAEIRQLIHQLNSTFLPGGTEPFEDIVRSLLQDGDEYFVLGDFHPYCAAQQRVQDLYEDTLRFRQMQLHNIAKSGFFSSDRTIVQYARDIWHV